MKLKKETIRKYVVSVIIVAVITVTVVALESPAKADGTAGCDVCRPHYP